VLPEVAYSTRMRTNGRQLQDVMTKHRIGAGGRSTAEMQAFYDELVKQGLMEASALSWFAHGKVKHNKHTFNFAGRR
jgi:hypothetical protein